MEEAIKQKYVKHFSYSFLPFPSEPCFQRSLSARINQINYMTHKPLTSLLGMLLLSLENPNLRMFVKRMGAQDSQGLEYRPFDRTGRDNSILDDRTREARLTRADAKGLLGWVLGEAGGDMEDGEPDEEVILLA